MVEAENRIANFSGWNRNQEVRGIGECAVDNRGGARERLSRRQPSTPCPVRLVPDIVQPIGASRRINRRAV